MGGSGGREGKAWEGREARGLANSRGAGKGETAERRRRRPGSTSKGQATREVETSCYRTSDSFPGSRGFRQGVEFLVQQDQVEGSPTGGEWR